MVTAILGGISILSGVYSAYQQNQSQGRVEDNIAEQNRLLNLQNIYAQDRYNDSRYALQEFQADYGSTMKNLKSYYDGLTSDVFESQMVDQIGRKFKSNSEQLIEQVGARGIGGSGIEADLWGSMYEEKATLEGQAAYQAPQMVANAQQDFYSNVLSPYEKMLRGQETTDWNNRMATQGNMLQGVNTQMAFNQNMANQYGAGASAGIGQGAKMLGGAWDTYQAGMLDKGINIPNDTPTYQAPIKGSINIPTEPVTYV